MECAQNRKQEGDENDMQISSRFTIAVHMMTCMETFKEEYKVTSDFLASSIGMRD